MSEVDSEICPLCDRVIERDDRDRHHLIPKQKGGRKGECVTLHRFCHRKVHSLFTNSELKKSYKTIEDLRAAPEIIAFVEWVAGKPSSFNPKNRQKKRG